MKPEPLDIEIIDCPHCNGSHMRGVRGTYAEGVAWTCTDCNGTHAILVVNGRQEGTAYRVAEAEDGQLYDAELVQDLDGDEGYIEGIGPVWVREETVSE